jgi:putative flippase GtrA
MKVLKNLKKIIQVFLFRKIKLNIKQQKQFVVFILVGGINTVFGYSIFAFFIFLKISYYLAFLFAASLGLIFNFMTTGRIVFKNKDFSLFYKFIIISIIMYFLHLILIRIINVHINNFYISGLMTMSVTALIAFYLNKKIFTSKNSTNNMEEYLNKSS